MNATQLVATTLLIGAISVPALVGTARRAVRDPFIDDTARTPQRGVPTNCRRSDVLEPVQMRLATGGARSILRDDAPSPTALTKEQ